MANDDLTPVTNQAEDDKGSVEETTSVSSDAEKNSQQTEEAETKVEATEEKVEAEGKLPPVPYDRFDEIRRERDELRAKLAQGLQSPTAPKEPTDPTIQAVKQQLKELGFVEKAEIDQVLKQKDEDAQVQRQLDSLESKYSGTDGRPKFDRQRVLDYAVSKQILDLETAYKSLHEKELIDWHIRNASKGTALKTETSDGSGASNVATTDDDLKNAIQKGDRSSLTAFLKRRIREAQSRD